MPLNTARIEEKKRCMRTNVQRFFSFFLSFSCSTVSVKPNFRADYCTRPALCQPHLRHLQQVYEDQLVGLMGLLGLEEDHLGFPGGKRCRSGSIGLASLVSSSPKEKKMDKQLADLVESSIGEAFEASLHLGGRQGGPSPPGPLSFAGRHRRVFFYAY